MKKSWRLLGSFALIGLLAYRLDWAAVGHALAGLDPRYWLVSAGLYLTCQTISTFRWQLLSEPLGLAGRWTKFASFYYIGMFFNLALPTSVGGDAVRAWYVAGLSDDNLPHGRRTSAVASVLVDRITGLLMLIALACTASLLSPFEQPLWMHVCVLLIGLAALSGPLVLFAMRTFLHRTFPDTNSKILTRLLRLLDTFWFYRDHLPRVGIALALSGVIQFLNAMMVWTLALGLGLPLPLSYCCLVVPLVTLLTMVPISVSGMGLREAGFAILLAPLGIAEAKAVTLGFLTFTAITVSSLPGLALYLFGDFPRYQNADDESSNQDPSPVETETNEHPLRRRPDQERAGQPPAAA